MVYMFRELVFSESEDLHGGFGIATGWEEQVMKIFVGATVGPAITQGRFKRCMKIGRDDKKDGVRILTSEPADVQLRRWFSGAMHELLLISTQFRNIVRYSEERVNDLPAALAFGRSLVLVLAPIQCMVS